jgi:hypothetical protein
MSRFDDRFRVAVRSGVRSQQADEMRDPHSRREALAANVAECQHQTLTRLFNAEEIARQMPHGENLARNVEHTVTHEARRAQSPVHLCRLEDRSVQLRVIALKLLEPEL